MRNNCTKQGFTLIELLIVIAIIGILSSIVLVSLNTSKNRAKIANFKKQAANIGKACQVACDKSTPTAVSAPAIANNYTNAQTYNCGCSGSTFSVNVVAGNKAAGLTCTATVTDTGITGWAGSDC